MITSVKEIARGSLLKKPKKKATPLSSHLLVKEAKEQLVKAQREYLSNHIIPVKIKVRAQQFLDHTYATVEAEFVQRQMKSISKLRKEKKHSVAWKVGNEISGRNSKPSIKI